MASTIYNKLFQVNNNVCMGQTTDELLRQLTPFMLTINNKECIPHENTTADFSGISITTNENVEEPLEKDIIFYIKAFFNNYFKSTKHYIFIKPNQI